MRQMAACVVAAAAAGAGAQTVEVEAVVVGGAGVAGSGAVSSIENLAVNSGGDWLVEVDTDFPDPDRDGALLGESGPLLLEGQALVAPAGATLDSFDSITLNSSGDSGWNFFLADTGSLSTDSGVFFNDVLVIQESDISSAPGFSPGTPYIGFFETKFNDVNQILIMASVDDPAIASSVDRAMVIVDYDAGSGAAPERIVYKEGDLLPEQVEPIEDFETGPHQFDFNNTGDVLFIADLAGSTSSDGALYLNDTLLAQEGIGSGIAGRTWRSFGSAAVALNDAGQWAVRAQLDGDTASDIVILSGGTVMAQEGSPVPGFPGATLTSLGTGPIGIDSGGRIFWYGAWDGGEALFRDDLPIIVAGETQVFEGLITDISGVQDGFAVSDDGRYIIAEVSLDSGRAAAVLAEFTIGCYADCDSSGSLDFFDFLCFQNAFAAGDPYADCDKSGSFDFFDFLCFQNSFAAGCP